MIGQTRKQSGLSSPGGVDGAADADSGGQREESAQTMPLLSGAVGPDDLPEWTEADLDSAGGRRIGRGTLLLLLVFAIGIGTLYAMRHSQLEVDSSADVTEAEEKVKLALARLAASFALAEGDVAGQLQLVGDQTGNTEAIVALFATDPALHQVPLEFLKKNPFLLGLAAVVEVLSEPKQTISDEEARLQALQMQFADLQLQTVMGGASPMAIVDGQIVKVGHSVGPFKVTAIEDRTVILESDGHQFRLRMTK